MNVTFNYIITILFLISISCTKKTKVDFTTDKDVYAAGETVKLTNNSHYNIKYIWTMPNGEKRTVNNAAQTYTIDPNSALGDQTFKLEAKSKLQSKFNYRTHKITVVPRSWFSRSSYFFPLGRFSRNEYNTVNYQITGRYSAVGDPLYFDFTVFFQAGTLPFPGTYTLQSSSVIASSYNALIKVSGGHPDAPSSDYYTYGQIEVEYINNVIHIYFDKVYSDASMSSYPLSGNIYYIMP